MNGPHFVSVSILLFKRHLLSILFNLKLILITKMAPITFGDTVKGINCLSLLESWDHGFESHYRHGRLCLFWVCVGSGLATG
jgi:hypothetical protein